MSLSIRRGVHNEEKSPTDFERNPEIPNGNPLIHPHKTTKIQKKSRNPVHFFRLLLALRYTYLDSTSSFFNDVA